VQTENKARLHELVDFIALEAIDDEIVSVLNDLFTTTEAAKPVMVQ
jgi:hypothetical protein